MANEVYDLVVIGGGPAGYAAAIRAGQLGKKVACIEVERAGGTCLNWGCIPSKALLKAAETYEAIQHAGDFGVEVKDVKVDFAKVMARSRTVSDKMAGGIEFLFKKNKVEYLLGTGHISVPGIVEITSGPDKGKFLSAKKTLIATGCRSRRIPGLEVDGERVMTSREALVMKKQPKSIAIIGAGAIGVEFAYFLNTLGTETHLIEMLDRVVPVEDPDISQALNRSFKKQGIKINAGTKVENIEVGKKSVKMELVKGEKRTPLEVDTVLLSIGVVANTEGLLSDKVKPQFDDKGYLVVNDRYETSLKNVYAAGDIIGPPWLAHVATYEAVQAVNGMFGHSEPKRVTLFPGCTYCHPQIASVGITEEKAKADGLDFNIGKFPFSASGKAVAVNKPEGFVKLVLDAKHGEILGAHIIGNDATELITEYVLAMKSEITADEIHATIHAHPTMSEALAEAAASAHNEAIHI
ncbi:dihydrolipoyl dehydrogenase [Puniceicoccales bacterium CK1056]|uniref:Dihydrolipoyl dehydrogenase n=1 Tax=Oceanipulchritudo coccoides TaxID=2706888 RepID=A0A6B2M2M9_9BACT|nr:dihydrolipoyl dehydrogenase [Oceanipulchritudo coccoides]NDV61970.1 dihydrolipoyl dehydrogenase [Oceanipulchritudo coccoides]